MGTQTNIAWCDHTWNPWRGCSPVSPGCENCYAREQAKRNPRVLGTWGPEGMRVVGMDAYWRLPERWNAAAARDRVRRRVFLGSMMDFFEDWQGTVADNAGHPRLAVMPDGSWAICEGRRALTLCDLRALAFRTIDRCQHLDFIIVTKRPENVWHMWPGAMGQRRRLNVWLLASVENQEQADRRIPELVVCRDLAPVLGLSCEPLLGPLDLSRWLFPECDGIDEECESGKCHHQPSPAIDWVIVGGESGPRARPCNVAWIRSIVGHCRYAKVPCFVKQLGDSPVVRSECTGELVECVTKAEKGADPSEWPKDLRVMEFPG